MNRSHHPVSPLRKLNLHHLRGFLEVIEAGGISAAAGRLGASEPALTQAMLKLVYRELNSALKVYRAEQRALDRVK